MARRRAIQEGYVLSLTQFVANGTATGGVGSMTDDADRVLTSEELLSHVRNSLDDDKAEDVVQIDLRGKSEMADYMLICSGRSSRQVGSISERLVERMKQEHGRPAKIEGKESGDWVLIDLGDIIVHVFRPEVREFYQLEKMWLDPEQAAARI